MNEIIQGLMKFLKSYTNMKMQYILQGLVLSSYNGKWYYILSKYYQNSFGKNWLRDNNQYCFTYHCALVI